MAARQLHFGNTARHDILRGIDALANTVKVTLGPHARHVLLEKKFGSPLSSNDGATIAKDIALTDPFANIGAQLVCEVATKTSHDAGDGTTTATGEYGDLLARGIIDPTKVERVALQNAASLAGLVLTTEVLIAEEPEEQTDSMP